MSNRQDSDNANTTIDPAHLQRVRTAVRETAQVASIATVRASVADVLDAGRVDEDSRQRAWLFLLKEDDEETERRGEFIDTVAARIIALQAEPHLFDTVLLARLQHARDEYHRGYSDGWEDAMADREEMRAKVREGLR